MASENSESDNETTDTDPSLGYFAQVTGSDPTANAAGESQGSQPTDTESQTTALSDIESGWTEYFPFEEPYQDQVDGIDAYIDSLADYDNMVMEGACGTGKTLIGLTAGIHHLRNRGEIAAQRSPDTPQYSRVFAVTPVKQQLKQFIDEMRTINRQLDDSSNVSTTVMRGLEDMHPYSFVDDEPFDKYPVSAKLDDLKETVEEIIEFGANVPLNWPASVEKQEWSDYRYDWEDASEEALKQRREYRYDPHRARAVTKTLANMVESGADPMVVNGAEAPFPDEIPRTEMIVDEVRLDSVPESIPDDAQGYFDPFYIGFFARDQLPFSFSDMDQSVADGTELFEHGVTNGVCPHQAMADMGQRSEVLIGNYYHVFDPSTRLLTDIKMDVLDEETICIVDEAHNIEENVREILSDTCGTQAFQVAKNDLQAAQAYVEGNYADLPNSEQVGKTVQDVQTSQSDAQAILEQPMFSGYTSEDIGKVSLFVTELEQRLINKAESHLSDEYDDHQSLGDTQLDEIVQQHPSDVTNKSLSLDDPEQDTVDDLTTEIEESFEEDIWETAYMISQAAVQILEEISDRERDTRCAFTAEFFYNWKTNSHIEYFREVLLEKSLKDDPLITGEAWTKGWTPKYQLYNCIPTQKLRELFSELGSVLLMSATLEPVDDLIKTTGVNNCISPATIEEKDDRAAAIRSEEAETDDSMSFRDVTVRQYPLRFAEHNRESLIVSAPKFTYSNRKRPTTTQTLMTDERETYADMVETIASSHGNILICLPSYSEAEWAQDILLTRGVSQSKTVVLDQSSSADETDETLQTFFEEDDAVILTSNRGTVTEGVDYDGEKLHTCAVIGVSLLPPSDRNTAVQAAYDECVDGVSGFESTNAIPAVRKARQAIGRVIRGDGEVGTRIFVDERYADTGWSGMNNYLSSQEQHEFTTVSPQRLPTTLTKFWQRR